jgi:acetylornithine deacetylase/succinyl-diaminopimelate desuccinylase-like protein
VRIPSVLQEGLDGYPFGPAIAQTLRTALEIARGLGFRTHYDGEGYYGFAEIGKGEQLVGILGHLDVVPPGKLAAWETGPFDPVEKDELGFPFVRTGTAIEVKGKATYARAIDNCVAFGALFPGELLTEHQPNERAVLANLFHAMHIYASAIYALTSQ